MQGAKAAQNRVGLYGLRREVFTHLGKRLRLEFFKLRVRPLITDPLNHKADGFEAKRLCGVRNMEPELVEAHMFST